MNLDGKVTNPGELRTRVVLRKRTMVQDAGGYQVPTRVTLATVWAKWVNAHGSEARLNESEQVEAWATVTIRWREDVDRTCDILKGGQAWEIVSMDNVRERNEYIEMQMRRVGAG